MRLKSSNIVKRTDEIKDIDEFSLSMRVTELEDENEAETVRRALKVALVKLGGQAVLGEEKS